MAHCINTEAVTCSKFTCYFYFNLKREELTKLLSMPNQKCLLNLDRHFSGCRALSLSQQRVVSHYFVWSHPPSPCVMRAGWHLCVHVTLLLRLLLFHFLDITFAFVDGCLSFSVGSAKHGQLEPENERMDKTLTRHNVYLLGRKTFICSCVADVAYLKLHNVWFWKRVKIIWQHYIINITIVR